MKWIVITPPQFLPNEATFINLMFTHGLDVLHLRKPHASATDCEQLLQQIDSQWLPQVVVHDHFDLCRQYELMGVHLNQRNPQPPIQHQGSISRSCHSLSEVKQYSATCQYVTLSPIFNSISKQGYQAAFSQQALTEATQQGIVNDKVIALGGISLDNIAIIKQYGFGGAALLGDVWQRINDKNIDRYLCKLRQALI